MQPSDFDELKVLAVKVMDAVIKHTYQGKAISMPDLNRALGMSNPVDPWHYEVQQVLRVLQNLDAHDFIHRSLDENQVVWVWAHDRVVASTGRINRPVNVKASRAPSASLWTEEWAKRCVEERKSLVIERAASAPAQAIFPTQASGEVMPQADAGFLTHTPLTIVPKLPADQAGDSVSSNEGTSVTELAYQATKWLRAGRTGDVLAQWQASSELRRLMAEAIACDKLKV